MVPAIQKNQFGVDEIHEVRRRLSEERRNMTHEEFNAKYDVGMNKIRADIELLRKQVPLK